MSNSSISSNYSHSVPIEGTSIQGVTSILKDTHGRDVARKMVEKFENLGLGSIVSPWEQHSLPMNGNRELLKMLNEDEANNSQAKLVVDELRCTPVVPRQDALVPTVQPEKKPQAVVVIHAQLLPEQQPGLITRTRTSCLNFFQRCFGRATR